MSTISVKRLLFGLIIMLFSFILVFAGFVLLLLDVVVRVFYTDSSVGNEVGIVLLVAVFVGVIGLAVAYVGFAWND